VQLALGEKWGMSFVKGVRKIAITRSAVLAQNAPQTVCWLGSASIQVGRMGEL